MRNDVKHFCGRSLRESILISSTRSLHNMRGPVHLWIPNKFCRKVFAENEQPTLNPQLRFPFGLPGYVSV